MRLDRRPGAVLLLTLAAGCAHLPWNSPEAFFSRCMADQGHPVTEVAIEIDTERGSTLDFSPPPGFAEEPGGRLDASVTCWDQVLGLYE